MPHCWQTRDFNIIATLLNFQHITTLHDMEILRHISTENILFHYTAPLPASETLDTVSRRELEEDGTINLVFGIQQREQWVNQEKCTFIL